MCRSPTSKEQIYVLHVEVVTNKDFKSIKRKCVLQILVLLSKKKSQQGIERALFVALDVLPNRPSVWLRGCYGVIQQHKWISGIFMKKRVLLTVSLQISKYPLAVLAIISNAMGNAFWDRIFEQSVEQSPRQYYCSAILTKRSKVMKRAQKSDFSQVWLKHTHYVHIMLRLFPLSVATRASACAMDKWRFNAVNYLWVTTLSPRVPKSYFDWSKCSDPFLGR